MKIHLEQITGNDKFHGRKKIRFRRLRIRENMWWTRYRLDQLIAKKEKSDKPDPMLSLICGGVCVAQG